LHLEDLASLVVVEGGSARLLPVFESAQALYGKSGGKGAPVRRIRGPQTELSKGLSTPERGDAFPSESKTEKEGATLIDCVHQREHRFAVGRPDALEHFLIAGGD